VPARKPTLPSEPQPAEEQAEEAEEAQQEEQAPPEGVEDEQAEEPAPAQEELTEEEEEAARKKRVMERMAKMGGFNPFAAQMQGRPAVPVRRESEQSVRSGGGRKDSADGEY
jgi:hypothetical protein